MGGVPLAQVDSSYLADWQKTILSRIEIHARLIRGTNLLVLNHLIAGSSVPLPTVQIDELAREVYLVLRMSPREPLGKVLSSLTLQLTSPEPVAGMELEIIGNLSAGGCVYFVVQVIGHSRMLPGDTPDIGDSTGARDSRKGLVDVIPTFRALRLVAQ